MSSHIKDRKAIPYPAPRTTNAPLKWPNVKIGTSTSWPWCSFTHRVGSVVIVFHQIWNNPTDSAFLNLSRINLQSNFSIILTKMFFWQKIDDYLGLIVTLCWTVWCRAHFSPWQTWTLDSSKIYVWLQQNRSDSFSCSLFLSNLIKLLLAALEKKIYWSDSQ